MHVSAATTYHLRACARQCYDFPREVSLDQVLQLEANRAQERWRKAVDNLWREVLYYRRARLADRERERAQKRLENLRRIVRRALAEYHRLELERQGGG